MTKFKLLIFLMVSFFAGSASVQSAPERIRISYSSSGVTSIDLFIARDKKYFQEQKLNAELVKLKIFFRLKRSSDSN